MLVLDDDANIIKVLKSRLENSGFQVICAYGGKEGIEKASSENPDLLLLDIMMPEVDGFAVLEQLKGHALTRDIPVVVVTAKELTRDERAQLQQRVEALLEKGLFDQQQLLSDVAAALNRLAA